MDITYVGACLDSSGYAEAARNNIAALHKAGVSLAVMPVSFEGKKSDLGNLGKLIKGLVARNPRGRIQILHMTPHHYPQMVKSDKYSIGYAAWETSKLPNDWVGMVNTLDEVWVPSKHNVTAFKESGVTIPVICMPHTFDTVGAQKEEVVLVNKHSSDFVFYSIFQWLERKNPIGLIRAYLTEFKQDEKVVLVLKTFLLRPGHPEETDQIKKKIQQIKKTLWLPSYPKMLLISDLLTRDQMMSLHKEGDCYVSLHRCEGFGIPLAEAMMAGNPVISTNYGGPADFVKENHGYLVDQMLTPVAGMPWESYRGDQLWAEPDLMQAKGYIREVFENQKAAKEKGEKAKKWIKRHLSWKSIGEKMKTRLGEING